VCQKNTLENIKLYPNPGKDYITVVSQVENCHFELIDAKGTVVKSVKLKQGSNTINTSSLKQGIYIYKTVIGNEIVTGKWIKI
jgi:aminopeptidase YwaD